MTGSLEISVAIEGPGDEGVVRRLLEEHSYICGPLLGRKGKGYIDSKLPAFNAAAKHGHWFVVRDMDRDASCAAELVTQLLPQPNPGMRFRIAVRAIEAWLLADADGFSAYFHVAKHAIPNDPDGLPDPKRALIGACQRSRLRAIRDDMVPAAGTTARVGPGYVARVNEFAAGEWDIKRAARRSDSLKRCIAQLTW